MLRLLKRAAEIGVSKVLGPRCNRMFKGVEWNLKALGRHGGIRPDPTARTVGRLLQTRSGDPLMKRTILLLTAAILAAPLALIAQSGPSSDSSVSPASLVAESN